MLFEPSPERTAMLFPSLVSQVCADRDCWGSGLRSCAGGSVLQTSAPLSSFLPIYLWHLCCLLLPLAFFLFCCCLSLVRSDTASSWSHGEDFFIRCAHTRWGFKVIELAVGAVCIAEPQSPSELVPPGQNMDKTMFFPPLASFSEPGELLLQEVSPKKSSRALHPAWFSSVPKGG